MAETSEADFRSLIRALISEERYPEHRAIRQAMGRRDAGAQLRSGLSERETAWRVDEVERAGYDWVASKKARRLISRSQSG